MQDDLEEDDEDDEEFGDDEAMYAAFLAEHMVPFFLNFSNNPLYRGRQSVGLLGPTEHSCAADRSLVTTLVLIALVSSHAMGCA